MTLARRGSINNQIVMNMGEFYLYVGPFKGLKYLI